MTNRIDFDTEYRKLLNWLEEHEMHALIVGFDIYPDEIVLECSECEDTYRARDYRGTQ